jgi:hypothetical protein
MNRTVLISDTYENIINSVYAILVTVTQSFWYSNFHEQCSVTQLLPLYPLSQRAQIRHRHIKRPSLEPVQTSSHPNPMRSFSFQSMFRFQNSISVWRLRTNIVSWSVVRMHCIRPKPFSLVSSACTRKSKNGGRLFLWFSTFSPLVYLPYFLFFFTGLKKSWQLQKKDTYFCVRRGRKHLICAGPNTFQAHRDERCTHRQTYVEHSPLRFVFKCHKLCAFLRVITASRPFETTYILCLKLII